MNNIYTYEMLKNNWCTICTPVEMKATDGKKKVWA